MSYSSLNSLEKSARKGDVVELVDLLGYRRTGKFDTSKLTRSGVIDEPDIGVVEEYYWFDEKEYRSWTGVELSIYMQDESICVETKTPIGRSFYDLTHQNKTIRLLKRVFGGWSQTDEGKGRFLRPRSGPPHPSESGTRLAYHRFGLNLITANTFFRSREFGKKQVPGKHQLWLDATSNPWIVANNLLVPFVVSIIEDYFRSSYVALLSHSEKRSGVVRAARYFPDQMVAIAEARKTVEEAIAEAQSFQNLGSVCQAIKSLDSRVDLAGALRKPYRRRKKTLYESLEALIEMRHPIVHRAQIFPSLDDEKMQLILSDVEISIVRCYRHLTQVRNWTYDQTWSGRHVRFGAY